MFFPKQAIFKKIKHLKGKSASAAILPSRMNVSYCTSGFFVVEPAKQLRGLKSRTHSDTRSNKKLLKSL